MKDLFENELLVTAREILCRMGVKRLHPHIEVQNAVKQAIFCAQALILGVSKELLSYKELKASQAEEQSDGEE